MRGEVIAVFGPAFYAVVGEQIICIGTAALEPGPVNLVTTAPARLDWRASGLAPGQPVWLSASEVRVGNRLRVPLAGAASWLPGTIKLPLDAATVARGLATFRAAFHQAPVAGGLARFIDPANLPGPESHECRAAAGAIAAARQWLDAALAGHGAEMGWAQPLLGLGSGLTPAGDDFLGGMMIALRALGHAPAADRLWQAVCPHAETVTNAISLALLRAAAEGLGSDSLHRALAAILRGDAAGIRDALPAIARIGHSSGWDAMAGVATVLDGWLRSPAASDAVRKSGSESAIDA